jgi:hypothetical protein
MRERALTDARVKQDELASIADPRVRLGAVIEYFLPLDDESLIIERGRVAMASQRNVEPIVAEHLEKIDPDMRTLIRTALSDFIEADRLEATVDLIRLWTAGVVLTAIEHPQAWTAERQTEALRQFMAVIELQMKFG